MVQNTLLDFLLIGRETQCLPFFCYKYISDNANKDAANDWELNIQKGADLFVKYIDNFI